MSGKGALRLLEVKNYVVVVSSRKVVTYELGSRVAGSSVEVL